MTPSDEVRVLIVDDDHETLDYLCGFFDRAGYHSQTMDSGRGVEQRVADEAIDVVILDIGLPEVSGISLLASLRQKSDVGIIMLNGESDLEKRVICLELGADDFVTKPFEPRELVARVGTIFRRLQRTGVHASDTECSFKFDRFTLLPHRRELLLGDDVSVSISSTEFSLLETFVRNPNEILTRERLLSLTYGDGISISERAIDVHVNRIRRKIEDDPKQPRLLKTIRHRGYLLSATVTAMGDHGQRR